MAWKRSKTADLDNKEFKFDDADMESKQQKDEIGARKQTKRSQDRYLPLSEFRTQLLSVWLRK